jgi:hypothetical protein
MEEKHFFFMYYLYTQINLILNLDKKEIKKSSIYRKQGFFSILKTWYFFQDFSNEVCILLNLRAKPRVFQNRSAQI